jgi:hypothetical protein
MPPEEVKQSFSIKYIALTLIIAALVSAVGLGVSKLFDSKSVKKITVFDRGQTNLLNDDALPKDQIEASYYLKGEPKKQIASLFRKVVAIKNSGSEGAENILVSFSLKGDDLKLVSKPKITTEPKEINDAISVTKAIGSTDNNHLWNISLLNPGESVVFEYSVYSEKKVDNINFNIIPRKKDWTISTESYLSQKNKEASATKLFILTLAAIISTLPLMFLIAFPFYYVQWHRRSDFRDKYKTFYVFFRDHSPGELFKD